jgi:hypothetical protein
MSAAYEIGYCIKTYARLREGEELFIKGYGNIDSRNLLKFRYDRDDNFYIIINGEEHSVSPEQFNFISVLN